MKQEIRWYHRIIGIIIVANIILWSVYFLILVIKKLIELL